MLALLALAVTTIGLIALRAVDPKRRRIFGLPVHERRVRTVWAARLAMWLPGVALLGIGDIAGVVIWMGGATVIGWGIAATTPAHLHWAQTVLDAVRGRCRSTLRIVGDEVMAPVRGAPLGLGRLRAALPRPEATAERLDDRVTYLEARVAELEAMIAKMGGTTTSDHPAREAAAPTLARRTG